jgi:hypothetical protein
MEKPTDWALAEALSASAAVAASDAKILAIMTFSC